MKTYEGYIYDVLQDVAENSGIKLFENKVLSEEQEKRNFNPWLTEKSINAMKLLKSVYAICEKSNGSIDDYESAIIQDCLYEIQTELFKIICFANGVLQKVDVDGVAVRIIEENYFEDEE